MRLIKDNVERIAESETRIAKLKADGFKELGTSVKELEKRNPIHEMKLDELKTLAKEKGIEGAASLTKAELLAVLKDVSSSD